MYIMKSTHMKLILLLFAIGICMLPEQTVYAQDGPPQFVREAVHAVETVINSNSDEAIKHFIDTNMNVDDETDMESLFEKIKSIRNETKGLRDDIYVEAEPDGISLFVAGGQVTKRIKIELSEEGISDLNLAKTAEPILLMKENLKETFNKLESEGFAGIIYIKKDNKVLLERAFGYANPELKIPNTLNTIFGTGSRPIDYTIAAIYLLNQQNKIELDDTIDKYFSNVPKDKKPMTIRHLLTGQSGLPDFFHTEKDWDPDLAWIDRDTAEKRILSQKLLFKPGEDRRHSHAAFVLLAALIEHVSGMDYYSFLKKNFFEPAEMNLTGEYGETFGYSLDQFAEGDGPQFVGLPNIPPNWGPTSWLVKGSGGMVSTLNDLQKFYAYILSGKVLDKDHYQFFTKKSVNLDGSDRGFELFSYIDSPDNQIYLFINAKSDREKMRQLFQALEKFAEAE